eukprot:1160191-Pelagomonas_calceolata.AAC.1
MHKNSIKLQCQQKYTSEFPQEAQKVWKQHLSEKGPSGHDNICSCDALYVLFLVRPLTFVRASTVIDQESRGLEIDPTFSNKLHDMATCISVADEHGLLSFRSKFCEFSIFWLGLLLGLSISTQMPFYADSDVTFKEQRNEGLQFKRLIARRKRGEKICRQRKLFLHQLRKRRHIG